MSDVFSSHCKARPFFSIKKNLTHYTFTAFLVWTFEVQDKEFRGSH